MVIGMFLCLDTLGHFGCKVRDERHTPYAFAIRCFPSARIRARSSAQRDNGSGLFSRVLPVIHHEVDGEARAALTYVAAKVDWTASELKIGIRLALYQGLDDGRTFPGYETIARDSGVSGRQTLRVLKKLERLGWLGIDRWLGGSNDYRFLIPDEGGDTAMAHPDAPGGAPFREGGAPFRGWGVRHHDVNLTV